MPNNLLQQIIDQFKKSNSISKKYMNEIFYLSIILYIFQINININYFDNINDELFVKSIKFIYVNK
jgi:hypothetical protein